MQEFYLFQRRFITVSALLGAAAAAVLLILGFYRVVPGMALGGSVALFAFWFHGRTLSRAFKLSSRGAKVFVFFSFLGRYLLYFVTLAVALQRGEWHFFWGAAGGLLLPRLVILFFYTFKIEKSAAVANSNQE